MFRKKLYAVIPLLSCWLWNMIVYSGSRLVNSGRTHYDMTTPFDETIPLIPAFIMIYFGCFAFWVFFYWMCGSSSKSYCAKFVTFDLLTRTICGIIFILLPTYNVRPAIPKNDFFGWALGFLYQIDSADNLFPSIHCLVSWNCFVGLRGLDGCKRVYKVTAAVMAILVFISTLVTKQHVVVDIFSAVLISELCWYAVNHTRVYLRVWKCFNRLNHKVVAVASSLLPR